MLMKEIEEDINRWIDIPCSQIRRITIEYYVSYRFVIYGLYYVPFMSTFWRVFIINGCLILSEAFSASVEMIIWFLFLNFLMWYISMIDLRMLKNPCIPEMNPSWSWCMIFMTYWWIQMASILLRIFASMFISDIGLAHLFIVAVCKSQNSQQGGEARNWYITESYTYAKCYLCTNINLKGLN